MNEKTENYEIINGDLVWINPELKEFTIPEGVVKISPLQSSNLESICFSNTVKYVGDGAFSSVNNLRNVTLNEGLEEIGTMSFMDTCITTIDLPSSLFRVSSFAFKLCRNLEKVIIKNPTLFVASSAFSDCINLEEFTFPISSARPELLKEDKISGRIKFLNFNCGDGSVIGKFSKPNFPRLRSVYFYFDNSENILNMIYSEEFFKLLKKVPNSNHLGVKFMTSAGDEDELCKILNRIYRNCDNSFIIFSLIISRILEITKEKITNAESLKEEGIIPNNMPINKEILKRSISESSMFIGDRERVSEVLSAIYYLSPKYSEIASGVSVYDGIKELRDVFTRFVTNLVTADEKEQNLKEKYFELINTICSRYIDKILFTDEYTSDVFKKFIDDVADGINDAIKDIYVHKMQKEQGKCDETKRRVLENF